MLIQKKNLSAGDVVVLKPIEGADIIGRLSEEYKTNDPVVTLTKPLTAHMVQRGEGVGLAFAPFSLAARDDQVFSFRVAELMVDPFPARDEVKKTYIGQTTSLLAL